MMGRYRLDAVVSMFVTVHPHETSALLHAFFCFFFILSAYFVVLPLRDEGAISLGLSNLPGLFVGSLLLTIIAAPFSSLVFSLPNLSKNKALVFIHRFFSISLVVFFILWHYSSAGYSSSNLIGSAALTNPPKEGKLGDQGSLVSPSVWDNHRWFYISVRIGLFLWVALLNLITISSTWARVIDVMDNESGSRLFGFIGAGATLGQLFGSLFATGMAFLGPFLLLLAALLMELAAQTSRGISRGTSDVDEELFPIRESDSNHENEADEIEKTEHTLRSSPESSTSLVKHKIWPIFEGLWLILSSTYLLHISLYIWLSAVVSSFFYFQKVSVVASTVTSSLGRRKLFAQINSVIAVFILVGQLSLTGRILTVAGVTTAICSAPFVGFLNLVALAAWPNWVVVAISETMRKYSGSINWSDLPDSRNLPFMPPKIMHKMAMDGLLTDIRQSLLQLTQDLAKMMSQRTIAESVVVPIDSSEPNGPRNAGNGSSHLEEFRLAARKAELPLFDGANPVGWITWAETYFEVQATPEDVKVKLGEIEHATIHWYNLLRETKDDLTRLKLRRALIERYRGQRYDNPFEELSVLKQEGNVEDYVAEFEYISSQVSRLPEEQYLGYFMGGLCEEIRCRVRTLGPLNRSQAMKVARDVEAELASLTGEKKGSETQVWSGNGSRNVRGLQGDANWAKKEMVHINGPNTGQNNPSPGSGPQTKGAQLQQAQLTKDSDRTTRGQRHLSNSEISDRRSKGLCFKCNERWHPLHQCTEKHLCIIIVGDDEVVGDDGEIRVAETEENGGKHSQP